jgi:two-component system, OmpR family, sensor histidine kinase BaeS
MTHPHDSVKNRSTFSLSSKITLSFFFLILILFICMLIFSQYFITSGFKTYTMQRIQQESQALVEQFENRFSDWDAQWEETGIQSIGIGAMERGLFITLYNSENQILWDAMSYNEGFCSDMLMHIESTMHQMTSQHEGGYEEQSYNLKVSGEDIGKLIIGYYGPYYFTDTDLKYIQTLNQLLLVTGFIGILLTLFLGGGIARRISLPLQTINKRAKKISDGDYTTNMSLKTSTREIKELSDTIHQLSVTLKQQEDLRRRLTSDIAHELRTPVSILQSHLELMIDGVWQPDTDKLKALQDETHRLSHLINELNQIHLLEAQQLQLLAVPLDLDVLCRDVYHLMLPQAKEKGLTFFYEGQPLNTVSDINKLKQIIINLLNNAIHYTPEGGTITMVLAHVPSTTKFYDYAITISDTGIGIPETDLPFYIRTLLPR